MTSTKHLRKYEVQVDDPDQPLVQQVGKEIFPDDQFGVTKSMAEIIINAANYAASPSGLSAGAYHYSYFERPHYEEPRPA